MTLQAFVMELNNLQISITEILIQKDKELHKLCHTMIDNLLKKYKIEINIYFTIGTRNSMILTERENNINLIISPNFIYKNLVIVDELILLLKDKWNIVKYIIKSNSTELENIIINVGDTKITSLDITYEIKINKDDDKKVGLELFINNDLKKFIINDNNTPTTELLLFLESAIGEFNIIHLIEYIDITISDKTHKQLKTLSDRLKVLYNKNYEDIPKCLRCLYDENFVELIQCKCGVYYCDTICQNAHKNIHSEFCLE